MKRTLALVLTLVLVLSSFASYASPIAEDISAEMVEIYNYLEEDEKDMLNQLSFTS